MSGYPSRKAPRHNAATQEFIRIKAAKAVLAGKPAREVAEIFGVSASAVGNWARKARQHGIASLNAATRGRSAGQKRTLTAQQESQLKKWILEKDPRNPKQPFRRWDARAVMALIFQRFKIAMPLRTVQDYLYRWNFSARSPATRSFKSNPDHNRPARDSK
jgi:transposase